MPDSIACFPVSVTGNTGFGGIRSVGGGVHADWSHAGSGLGSSLGAGRGFASPVRTHRSLATPRDHRARREPAGRIARTQVQRARPVPHLASMLARQLTFLRNPMAAHGVPLSLRGGVGAPRAAPLTAMFAATCGLRRVRWPPKAGRRAMNRPLLNPPPEAHRSAGLRPASTPQFHRFGSLWPDRRHTERTPAGGPASPCHEWSEGGEPVPVGRRFAPFAPSQGPSSAGFAAKTARGRDGR